MTALLHAFFQRLLTLHLTRKPAAPTGKTIYLPLLLQEFFSTSFPWTPMHADAEAVAKLVEIQGGRMTPIWQAECPECAEEASDDLWRAAFEAWPTEKDSSVGRAELQCTELLGLSTELMPSLTQEVC